ncbi:MAG: TIM barrel protein [Verrucomicrobia bacterium]|jgi:sugar phosphate isomerase/epimerase|nr:TIM barrel protein [Verrucomicrobiota bacterium]OQC67169.1 MAG: Xylose isomerase-like TIM barrel [Verrucomicrobia bacterium ADurb.Bin006]MDI9379962.1 TIM barrel protein [Verrucomicrobiota bacterium]NMD19215.1 TIM barrel protein [Verrucomicrobiota bacterium]HNV00728.1 TIM barrel protein [Verrucomicrobiota bacterium]
MYYLTGISDEAGASIDAQIKATCALGWRTLEARTVEVEGFPGANLHEIPERAFELAVEKLESAGIGVCCFGSTIMNWAKTVQTPFAVTLAETRRAIPRMQRLGTRFVRIMSFKPADDADTIPAVVFERVREVTRMFLDAGLQPVHENCMNHGGMSARHALELLENVPGLKWVFDTANPIFNPDRSRPKPWSKQDPWYFWTQVREATMHIHIKDATWNPEKNDADYRWPGEGDGRVRDIVKDALSRGYDGGISIEPHMAVVFHDSNTRASAEAQYANYIEYGRRLAGLIGEVERELQLA